jgi:CIC family chloride channel protein
VGEDTPVSRLREIMAQSKFHSFPVVDDRDNITGIVSTSDCQRRADSPRSPGGARAGDVAIRKVVTVNMEDDLLTAFKRMAAGDFAILPVLRGPHSRKLVGVISRGDIFRTYNEVVLKRAGKDGNNA